MLNPGKATPQEWGPGRQSRGKLPVLPCWGGESREGTKGLTRFGRNTSGGAADRPRLQFPKRSHHRPRRWGPWMMVKLRVPGQGFRRDCVPSSKLDHRPDNLGVPAAAANTGLGRARRQDSHTGRETSRGGSGRTLLAARAVDRLRRRHPSLLLRSSGEGGTQEAAREQRWDLKARLWRQQKECPPHPRGETQLWTPNGEGWTEGVTDRGGGGTAAQQLSGPPDMRGAGSPGRPPARGEAVSHRGWCAGWQKAQRSSSRQCPFFGKVWADWALGLSS